jgi:hypothetical protein
MREAAVGLAETTQLDVTIASREPGVGIKQLADNAGHHARLLPISLLWTVEVARRDPPRDPLLLEVPEIYPLGSDLGL